MWSVYDRGMERASEADLTAFVLAGGKSSRMGRDKAFIQFEGRTLLERALDLARGVSTDVRIGGGRQKFGLYGRVVEDIFQDCGPLGGIHAALVGSDAELNLILAVDTPFLTEAFLQYLVGRARAVREALVVVPSPEGRSQPLCAVYRRGFAATAESALREGKNKIDRLFGLVSTYRIDDAELHEAGFSASMFRNLNTPEELEAGKKTD